MTNQTWHQSVLVVLSPVLIFISLALFYSLGLGKPATFDELYHVLAARGWLEHGTPVILDGTYERAQWFTWLVSQAFRMFGENLGAARLTTILPMASLGAVLFIWVRAVVGSSAAWVTTILYGLSPFAVEISVFIRFYSLQCLAFFLAAITLYRAIHGNDRWHWITLQLISAAIALGIAAYFQVATLIGALGLGAWFGVHILWRWFFADTISYRWKIISTIAFLTVVMLSAVLLFLNGFIFDLLNQYRSTPLFNQESADEFWFYHYWIGFYYPSLWPLLPIFTLIAFIRHPKVTIFAATIFGLAILIHSFAASKNLRYVAYTMPFLFIILGTALAQIADQLLAGLVALDRGLRNQVSWTGPSARLLSRGLIVVALLFLCLANTGSVRSVLFLADVTIPPERPNEQWSRAAEVLTPLINTTDLVITGNETETLYYLGRFDVIWGASRLSELPNAEEFTLDPRTGRPIISTAQSLERLQACYPNGIFITSSRRWSDVHRPETEVPFREALLTSSDPIKLPQESRILGFLWSQSSTITNSNVDCTAVKRLLGEPS